MLVLVSRHPARVNGVASIVSGAGLKLAGRSAMAVLPADVQVLLADSMGELMQLYGFADVAFVAG